MLAALSATHNGFGMSLTRRVSLWSWLGFLAVVTPLAWAEPKHSGTAPNNHHVTSPSAFPGDLHIRLSSKILVPPEDLVVRRIPLQDIHAARPFAGPPIHSAILEDEDRDRVLILTTDPQGHFVVYLLKDIALAPYVSDLSACTQSRRCATDRMPATGGLACVAICLREILTAERVP